MDHVTHPGLVILRRVCPDTTMRRRWVAEAVVAFHDASLTDALAVVGFLADSFVLADGERHEIIRFIAEI